MSDDIELISDGDGLAVVGKKSAVERFLTERGLLAISEDLKLGRLAQVADSVLNGISEASAHSGRWLKLTEESAELVEEFGLMETTTRGVSHAIIGDPGSISKWLQVDTGVGALLTNPAVLTGAAGAMAQLARQQEIREIKAYLAQIDTKVSEVLRAQKDAELARLFGARRSIDRAMSVREEQGGRTDPTTWSTVQDRVGAVDDLLSWAIIGLNRIAERLDAAASDGARAKLADRAEGEVEELLAVVAHCFELQDALDVLRLDRVMEVSPGDLDDQRSALEKHRQERRSSLVEATDQLVARIDAAAGAANAHVLLHANRARIVTSSANGVGESVAQLHVPLGIEFGRQDMDSPRWRDAARDGKQLASAGKEARPKLIVAALLVGGIVLCAVPATRPIATKAFEAARRVVR